MIASPWSSMIGAIAQTNIANPLIRNKRKIDIFSMLPSDWSVFLCGTE